ncbi:hypothetical protein BTHI11S_06059 [Bosea thiooxidans]
MRDATAAHAVRLGRDGRIFVEAGEDQMAVRHMFLEAEGPGADVAADLVVAELVDDALRIDRRLLVREGQHHRHHRRGLLEGDLDRQPVDLAQGADIGEHHPPVIGLAPPALERGDDVVGAQDRAVMERHVGAQPDNVGVALLVEGRALGQHRHGVELAVEREQPLIDVPAHRLRDEGGRVMRVERRRFPGDRDIEHAPGFRLRKRGQIGAAECNGQPGDGRAAGDPSELHRFLPNDFFSCKPGMSAGRSRRSDA